MKIKIVHLLLDPNSQEDFSDDAWNSIIGKQNDSIESISKISKYFYKYTQQFSKVNRSILNFENCAHPEILVREKPNTDKPFLSYGHYGAYLAHKNAILNEFSDDVDMLLIIEGDVIIDVSENDFVKTIKDGCHFLNENDGSLMTFGEVKYGIRQPNPQEELKKVGNFNKIPHFLCCHCYAISKNLKNDIIFKLNNTKWHAFDVWLFWNYDNRIDIYSTVNKIVSEPNGYSSIENKYKKYV